MKLFIGLGNPGPEYSLTRHNAGAIFIDSLRSSLKFPNYQEKFNGLFSKANIYGEDIALFRPLSYMNLSGPPVAKLVTFYKISGAEIFAFYDDMDLRLGKIRLKENGGSGGHNGIKSLMHHIGANFWRCKIGIDRPPHPALSPSNYVLERFSEKEMKTLEDLFWAMEDYIEVLLTEGPETYTSRVMQTQHNLKTDK